MATNRIDNLNAFDWDDSALIKAYNRGMSLKVDDLEEEIAKCKRKSSKRNEWNVGDYCRAVYPHDNLVYETKITTISGNICTVDFLGYHEEIEVDVDTLSRSKGKQARKKQIKNAREYYTYASADESASADDTRNNYSEMESPHTRKRDSLHIQQGNHVVDHSAAESAFQHTVYPAPAHCSGMQPATAFMPPAPPMLHAPEVAQNPTLCAMLSSWYMAGYYTGLHQGQKNQCHQRCCCRTAQNCCHH